MTLALKLEPPSKVTLHVIVSSNAYQLMMDRSNVDWILIRTLIIDAIGTDWSVSCPCLLSVEEECPAKQKRRASIIDDRNVGYQLNLALKMLSMSTGSGMYNLTKLFLL